VGLRISLEHHPQSTKAATKHFMAKEIAETACRPIGEAASRYPDRGRRDHAARNPGLDFTKSSTGSPRSPAGRPFYDLPHAKTGSSRLTRLPVEVRWAIAEFRYRSERRPISDRNDGPVCPAKFGAKPADTASQTLRYLPGQELI